jgi:uncharacterized protein (TIGR00255 family)
MNLKSMTGYACLEGEVRDRRVRVEARSFNSRYLEVRTRMPDCLSGMEAQVQALLREHVFRGRVEISVTFESREDELDLSWNRERARFYINLFQEMKEELKLSGDADLALLLAQKDVIMAGNSDVWGSEVWPEIKPILLRCFAELRRMREEEGAVLTSDFLARMDTLKDLFDKIEDKAEGLIEEYRLRLKRRLEEMLGEDAMIDQARLAQEVALLAERSDITEELVRLASHRKKFLELMGGLGPSGRKLEFLVQEMHREANTIGAKAQSAPISHLVVEIKSELERIREQVQNIE